MILRRLRPDDAGAVLSLEQVGMAAPWTARQVAEELVFPASLGFGVEEEGALCAIALIRSFPPECELLRIVTHPGARRQGLGARLLAYALAECAALGCETCFLEVRAGNAPALSLYVALGFQQDGRRKNYYDHPAEDALLLRKTLKEKA